MNEEDRAGNSSESERRALEEQLRLVREAADRFTVVAQSLEKGVVLPLRERLEDLQTALLQLREVVAEVRKSAPEARPNWLDSVEETARAIHAGLERLSVLDASQATSLAAVSEDLRALRSEVERVAASLGAVGSASSSRSDGAQPLASRETHDRAADSMLEIARMHVDLLRTLVERSLPMRSRLGSAQEAQGEVSAIDGNSSEAAPSPAEDKTSAARLRTELRGVAASLEHQLSELREEQQRRVQALERRLEDVQHVLDHALSQDHGRRLFLAVGFGLVFIVAVVIAGLFWLRLQSTSVATPQARQTETTTSRGDGPRDADYQRLLSEAELAIAKGEWDSAERALLQASRLRPGALEAQIALSAIQRKQPRGGGLEPSLPGGKQGGTGGLSCSVRENRLCCLVTPDSEQCVSWPPGGAQTASTSAPTPTVRTRQRTQRTPAVEVPPPALEDDAF